MMKVWLIKDYEDAKKAYKKLFYNSLYNSIFVEDENDFLFANKDYRRTEIWRSRIGIPDDIKTDIKSMEYIENNIEKIFPYNKFPCVATVPDGNYANNVRFYLIEEDMTFDYNSMLSDKTNLSEIKNMFEKYNVVVCFFQSGIWIPISYEEFRIITSKMYAFSFFKKQNYFVVNDGELEMRLKLNKKEIKNG